MRWNFIICLRQFSDLYLVQVIAGAIAAGVAVHAGVHLSCDFPRIASSSPEIFAHIASDFKHHQPTYAGLLRGVIGTTGIGMVVLMMLAFTLATRGFRRNGVKLPRPFNRVTGFNAFWYSHHLLALVYVLLLIHGTFLFLVHRWYQKTVWKYVICEFCCCNNLLALIMLCFTFGCDRHGCTSQFPWFFT